MLAWLMAAQILYIKAKKKKWNGRDKKMIIKPKEKDDNYER